MNQTVEIIVSAVCPACSVRVRFSKELKLGQILTCPECENTLEVIRVSPLRLGWAYEDEPDADTSSWQSEEREETSEWLDEEGEEETWQ